MAPIASSRCSFIAQIVFSIFATNHPHLSFDLSHDNVAARQAQAFRKVKSQLETRDDLDVQEAGRKTREREREREMLFIETARSNDETIIGRKRRVDH